MVLDAISLVGPSSLLRLRGQSETLENEQLFVICKVTEESGPESCRFRTVGEELDLGLGRSGTPRNRTFEPVRDWTSENLAESPYE